ncbi:hypothetical protein ACWDFL_31875 [Streptomyces bungoensis]
MDAFANSMDGEAVYSKRVIECPLAWAVEDRRAEDYRIVVPTLTDLTDTDLRRRLNLPPRHHDHRRHRRPAGEG